MTSWIVAFFALLQTGLIGYIADRHRRNKRSIKAMKTFHKKEGDYLTPDEISHLLIYFEPYFVEPEGKEVIRKLRNERSLRCLMLNS